MVDTNIIDLTQESDGESEHLDYDAKKSSDADVALITSSDNNYYVNR